MTVLLIPPSKTNVASAPREAPGSGLAPGPLRRRPRGGRRSRPSSTTSRPHSLMASSPKSPVCGQGSGAKPMPEQTESASVRIPSRAEPRPSLGPRRRGERGADEVAGARRGPVPGPARLSARLEKQTAPLPRTAFSESWAWIISSCPPIHPQGLARPVAQGRPQAVHGRVAAAHDHDTFARDVQWREFERNGGGLLEQERNGLNHPRPAPGTLSGLAWRESNPRARVEAARYRVRVVLPRA